MHLRADEPPTLSTSNLRSTRTGSVLFSTHTAFLSKHLPFNLQLKPRTLPVWQTSEVVGTAGCQNPFVDDATRGGCVCAQPGCQKHTNLGLLQWTHCGSCKAQWAQLCFHSTTPWRYPFPQLHVIPPWAPLGRQTCHHKARPGTSLCWPLGTSAKLRQFLKCFSISSTCVYMYMCIYISLLCFHTILQA